MGKGPSLGEAVLHLVGDSTLLMDQTGQAKVKVERILGGVGAGMQAVGKGVLAVGTAVGAVGAGIFAMTAKGAANADEILQMSAKYGIATDQLQKMKYASEFVDVSLDTMTGSFTRMTMSMDASKDGTGEQAAIFESLGVDVLDPLTGKFRDANDVWLETIGALGGVDNEVERNAMSLKIFGRSAMELNPLIVAGKDALRDLGVEAQNSGYVLSESQLSALGKVDDGIQRVKRGAESIVNQLAATFAPGVASVVDTVSGYMGQLGGIMGDESLTSGEKIAKGTELVKTIATDIATNLPKMVESGVGILKSLVEGIIASLPTLIPAVIEIVLSLVDFLIEMLPVLAEGAIQLVVGLAQGLAAAAPNLIPAIVQMVMTIWQVILDNLPLILQAGLQLVLGLVMGIVQAIPVLIAAIPQLIESIVSMLIQALPEIIQAAILIVIALITGIIQAIPQLIMAIPQIIMAIVNGLKGGIANISVVGGQLMAGFWEGMKSWFAKIWQGVLDFVKGIVDKIKGALNINSPSGVGFDIGANFAGSMGLGIQDRLNAVGAISGSAANKMANSAAAGVGAAGAGGSVSKSITIHVNNPVGENSDESIKRGMNRLQYLGVV